METLGRLIVDDKDLTGEQPVSYSVGASTWGGAIAVPFRVSLAMLMEGKVILQLKDGRSAEVIVSSARVTSADTLTSSGLRAVDFIGAGSPP